MRVSEVNCHLEPITFLSNEEQNAGFIYLVKSLPGQREGLLVLKTAKT